MKILVDHVLGQKPASGALANVLALLPWSGSGEGLLFWVVLAGLAIFFINSAVDVILTFAWTRVGRQMVYDLTLDLFARIQRRSVIFHTRNSVGDSISRITGDSWCVHTIIDTLLFAPSHALILIIVMASLMWRLDTGMTVLSLVVAPLMVAVSLLRGRLILTVARERREVESRIQSHVQQTLTGISVVKAFTREQRAHKQFQEFASKAIRTQQRGAFVRSISGLGSGLITTLGTAVVLWIGSSRVLGGHLTVGSLLVFISYLHSLQTQMKKLADVYSGLQAAGASVDRVMEVLEEEPEVRDRPGARPLPKVSGRLRFQDVTFGYDPGRAVMHNNSLEAEPGCRLAIGGPTGAAKSTLAGLIPRFYDPWHGRVLIDGQDLREVQLASLRAQVGIVLQEPFLFPITLAENIAYGRPDATRAEIEAAARAANAHDFIERLPEGYETVLGERGATLSGGERQRIAIARALLKDAPVLILDEPTAALDAQTEHLLMEALERLMAGRTVLIIAHRLSTIRGADRIVVLEGGEVAEEGTHAELIARDGLYARFYSIQSAEPQQASRARRRG
jgi:ATP-binding cassette subfamily B protein/subfamily B ATP-binding cassette protein MsbA